MELKRYLKIIWNRKWILIVTVVAVSLATYLMTKLIPPIYKSDTKLWVQMSTIQQKYLKDVPDSVGKFDFTNNDKAIGTLEEILNNSESINRVITEMGLTNRKGKKFTPDEFTNPNKLLLITHLQTKGYAEEQITDTDVIKVRGYSTDPSEAQAISSRVSQEFIAMFAKMNKKTAELANTTTLKRLNEVNKKFDDATTALENYKKKNKIYSLSTQMTTLISEKSALETTKDAMVRTLEGARVDIEKIKNAYPMDQGDIKDVIAKVETSTTLDNYKSQLLTLEIAQAGGVVEKTTEHPDVKLRKQQIELVKNNIRAEIAKSFPSRILERDAFFDRISERFSTALFTIIESTATIKYLDKQINERNKALSKLPENDKEINNLQFNIDSLKTVRDTLKSNYEAILSAMSMDLSNAFIIQPPTLYENAKDNQYFPPKKMKAALVAALLGPLLGLFIIFFVEYWNSDTPRSTDDPVKQTTHNDMAA